MKRTRIGAIAFVGLALAGCSTTSDRHLGTTATTTTTAGLTPATKLNPTQEAVSWFNAINKKDLTASLSHFQPNRRFLAEWNGDDVSAWPTFTNVHCDPRAIRAIMPSSTARSNPTEIRRRLMTPSGPLNSTRCRADHG